MTQPRSVMLGGGFGGLFTALDLAGSGEVTLGSDADHFIFAPMLYEYLSGEVEAWHIAPRFNELINEGDVRLIRDEVTSIDLNAQRVTHEQYKHPLAVDVLGLAGRGSTT